MVIAPAIDQDGVMSTIDDAPPLPDLPPLSAQADRLIALGVPQLAGLEEDSLRRAAEQWGGDRNDVLMALSPQCVPPSRSEEHTSELQSRGHHVCRLLLEKKK